MEIGLEVIHEMGCDYIENVTTQDIHVTWYDSDGVEMWHRHRQAQMTCADGSVRVTEYSNPKPCYAYTTDNAYTHNGQENERWV